MKLLNKDTLIACEIKYYIMKEKLKEGDKLPPERELAEIYNAQRPTIRSALKMLVQEGVIEARERSGYFIKPPKIEENLRKILSLSEQLLGTGKKVSNELISFEKIEVDKNLSLKVKLPIGVKMYKIIRRRYLVDQEMENCVTRPFENSVAVSLDYAYIPVEIAPNIMKYDLENRSLLEILKTEYSKTLVSDYQKIEVVYANEEESRLLSVTQLMPLVKKTSLIYGKDGEMLQYLKAVKKKDWITFTQHNPLIERKIGGVDHGIPDAPLYSTPKYDN